MSYIQYLGDQQDTPHLALACQLFVILLTRTLRLMMESLSLDLSEFGYQRIWIQVILLIMSCIFPPTDLQVVLTKKKEKPDFVFVPPVDNVSCSLWYYTRTCNCNNCSGETKERLGIHFVNITKNDLESWGGVCVVRLVRVLVWCSLCWWLWCRILPCSGDRGRRDKH